MSALHLHVSTPQGDGCDQAVHQRDESGFLCLSQWTVLSQLK